MIGTALTVLRKEWVDAIRDRRTLITALVMAVAAGPLIIVLVVNMIAGQRDRGRELALPVLGADRAPALIAFLESQQVRVSAAPEDFAARIRRGDLDVVLEIDEQFERDAARGAAATVTLHYDRSRDRARSTIDRAERLVEAYAKQWGDGRLLLRGIALEVARPLHVERANYATPQQSGALLLFIVAYYGLFAALVGGMAVALDTTAGERERGSLEPLLTTPASLAGIAVGKWLAAAAIDVIIVGATLLGFYLTLRFAPLPPVGIPFLYGLRELGRSLLIVLPIALLAPAVQLALGCRGRTYKEAQTNMQLVLFVVSILPLIQFFLQRKEPAWLVAVPVNGQYALLSRVLRGDPIPASDLLLSYAVPVVATVLCVAAFALLLKREAIAAAR